MMYKKKKNNKAALFFVLLVLVGYIFINFGRKVNSGGENKSNYEKEVVEQPEEYTTYGSTIEEDIVPEDPEINVVMIDEEYTVDVSEEVKGVDLFSCGRLSPVNTLDSTTKLCSEWDEEFEVKKGFLSRLWESFFPGKVRADSEAEIELVSVTYPLAFFLGQYVMQNSNREANIESPNYPSSGQTIDENYTLKTHIPQVSKKLKEKFQETVREQYVVWANTDIEGAGTEGSQYDENVDFEYEVVVKNADTNPCSLCQEEVTTSDYNPGLANRQGSIGEGYLRTQIPHGDPIIVEDPQQCLEAGLDYKMLGPGSGLGYACVDPIGIAKGLVASIFSIGKWQSCNTQQQEEKCSTNEEGEEVCTFVNTEDCKDLRNIGIKMSPIFGAVDECTDELCANAYLTNSYRAGLAPYQSMGKREISSNSEESLMFFLGTDCLANVKIGGHFRTVKVTCLWDASPLLLDYKLQAMSKVPGQKDFPTTFESHWNFVQEAIKASAKAYKLQ